MTKMRDLYVVDLEATCWDGPIPEGQEQEIIEIGVCHVDTIELSVKDKQTFLITPKYSEVSDFCEELTGLTQSKLEDDGVSFDYAISSLRQKVGAAGKPWASWGAWDRIMLSRQCKNRGRPFPFDQYHLNVKSLLTLNLGMSKTFSLSDGLSKLGLEFEGDQHRGIDDAYNASVLFIEMMKLARDGFNTEQ